MTPETRLDELDQDEAWDVARLLVPDITREQFEADWAEFLALKAAKRLN